MLIYSGETAKRPGDFRCKSCGEKIYVNKGEKIPKCPYCDSRNYDKKDNE